MFSNVPEETLLSVWHSCDGNFSLAVDEALTISSLGAHHGDQPCLRVLLALVLLRLRCCADHAAPERIINSSFKERKCRRGINGHASMVATLVFLVNHELTLKRRSYLFYWQQSTHCRKNAISFGALTALTAGTASKTSSACIVGSGVGGNTSK